MPFLRAEAGIFLMVDLRRWLPAPGFEGEGRLWERILEAGVNLTPGATLRCAEPGWFRLCFAAISRERVLQAVERLAVALKQA